MDNNFIVNNFRENTYIIMALDFYFAKILNQK